LTRASQENAFFRASSGEIARFFVISATEVAHLRHLRSAEMTKKEEKKGKKRKNKTLSSSWTTYALEASREGQE
jgi:hypothetical protein